MHGSSSSIKKKGGGGVLVFYDITHAVFSYSFILEFMRGCVW